MESKHGEKEIGYVQNVTINDTENRDNEVRVDVDLSPRRQKNARFMMPSRGIFVVPEEGDIVEVTNIGGVPIARWPYNTPDPGFPDGLGKGDIAIRLSEDTLLHFNKRDTSGDEAIYDLAVQATTAEIRNTNGEGFRIEDDGTIKLFGTELDIRTDGTVFDSESSN